MLREDFLQQNAYAEVDRFCPLEKAYGMLKVIMAFYQRTHAALEAGIPLERISGLAVLEEIARLKEVPIAEAAAKTRAMVGRVDAGFAELGLKQDGRYNETGTGH
jgi:V/A-type H+-transporting ATPase subunit A